MQKYDNPDIDIDFKDRNQAIKLLGGIPASIITDGKIRKHNTGMYYTEIPTDPMLGIASIDHKAAEKRGYFKLDFLNVGVYDLVDDEAHLDRMIAKEPNWNRLTTDPNFVEKIIHIGNYFHLLQSKEPESISEMAMFLAIIRPGKKHLQNLSWEQIEKTVWKDEGSGYSFKQSHATSYAMLVKVHMNLLEEQEHGI